MTIPTADMIDEGITLLKSRDAHTVSAELKELGELGDGGLKEVREALGGFSITDLAVGYLLGLETARVYLKGNLAAIQAKVEL